MAGDDNDMDEFFMRLFQEEDVQNFEVMIRNDNLGGLQYHLGVDRGIVMGSNVVKTLKMLVLWRSMLIGLCAARGRHHPRAASGEERVIYV